MKKEFLKKISEELKKVNENTNQDEANAATPNDLNLLNDNEADLALGGNQGPSCPKLDQGGCNPYGQCTADCFINIGKKRKKSKS